MNKNLNHNKRFVLEDKEGTKWMFFLSPSNRILYCRLSEENKSQNSLVDSQPVKDFYATIDGNGVIRILAYAFSRQLVYYEWINGRWMRQTLERIYSRFQNISYISILSGSNSTHILYYIESSLTKSAEFLAHYYLQEEEWYGGRVWKFISDESIIPRTAFIDPKDNLHIVFTRRKKNGSLGLFHARFHSDSLSWSEPAFIHAPTEQCSQFQLYIDLNENIHLVWIENINSTYYLKCLQQSKINPSASWNEATLYQSSHEISAPTIVHDDKLLCIWEENKLLHQITSLDSGRTWGEPNSLAKNGAEHFRLFHFISYNKIKSPSHSIRVWAYDHPVIELAGTKHSETKEVISPEIALHPDYSNKFAEIEASMSSINNEIKKEIKHNKNQIMNLSSQLDELYSALYELQEQLRLKERSIFAMQAEIKRLGFEIRRIHKQPKTVSIQESTDMDKDITSTTSIDNDKNSIKSHIQDGQNITVKPEPASEESSEESKESEKIILGNTTIIINPEDSDI